MIYNCSSAESVFDIGCGSGQFLFLLSKFTEVKSIKGIEISEKLIKNADQLFKNIVACNYSFELYDGINIPESVKEYAAVTMIDVLHHIPDKMQINFILQLYKRMKKGSKFILKDINAANFLVFANKFHDQLLGGGMGNEISLKKAEKLLKKIGFKIISKTTVTTLWYPHYIIICEK
jgi:2-polyprenyl-3-methyl-5-hydroxy-6-metoxy-1,4-benzoquinol methylase